MERRFAFPVIAALALTALSPLLPAAGDVPKPGTIFTVAGTGQPGFSGDGGKATQAQVNDPLGLAFDAAGNLYIGDVENHRVRRVSPDGTITTVAGTGQPGFSGDGGKATDAQLNAPGFVAVDAAGNLFISDRNNHRVRKVTPDGIISTYAGSGPVDKATGPVDDLHNGGFAGDNGPATAARLNTPYDVVVDSAGNLFIMDGGNNRVRKVSPDGVITTFAGNGADRSSGDGGPATKAGVLPGWLATDVGADLFISGDFRIRKVTPDGIITTIAGTGQPGFPPDGVKAADAHLDGSGLAVDSAGNLFVADLPNYRVRKVDGVTGIISTVAGSGQEPYAGYAGDGSPAAETELRGPTGLAIDALGNLLIADAQRVADAQRGNDGFPPGDRVLKVFGAAAPGLVAGMAFPASR